MELDYKVVLFCTQEDVDTLSQQYNVRSISRLNNEDDSDKNESESDEEVEDNGESETNEAMEEEEQNSGDEEEQEVFPYSRAPYGKNRPGFVASTYRLKIGIHAQEVLGNLTRRISTF